MASKLLITVAASALFTVPAFAQVSVGGEATQAVGATANAGGAAAATAADAAQTAAVSEPAAPAKPAKSMARTGTAADTSGVVGMADLQTGAAVRDASGAEIGTIAKVTPGAAGASAKVTLDVGGKMATVPASSLALSGGTLVSSKTKAQILAGDKR